MNDFIQLLEVDEKSRLGSQGIDSVKCHPWFEEVDWKGVRERTAPAPHDIICRINQHLGSRTEESTSPFHSPVRDLDDLNTPEWLEDW